MKIQMVEGKGGAWHWRLVARNGKILAASETYSSHAKMLKTVKMVWHEAKEWAGTKELCEVLRSLKAFKK